VLQEASRRGDVLITTHSPDLLDAAKDETILVCNLVDGVTRIGPLASGQRQLVREGLFRLAELMRAEPLRIEGLGELRQVLPRDRSTDALTRRRASGAAAAQFQRTLRPNSRITARNRP